VSRLGSMALFLLVATAIIGGMHFYLWARLVRDPQLAEPWRRILAVGLAVAAASIPAGMFTWRLSPSHGLRVLASLAFVWLGASFLLFVALVATDLVRLAAATAAWVMALGDAAPAPPDPARRVFLARAVAGTAVLAAGGATTLGFRGAVSDPEIHEVPVRLQRLPRALSGLTIAQISDLHVGATVGEKHVRRVVDLTNGMRPDLVAITGDLVDGSVEQLRAAIAPLARLQARYGVFFVTGNHEYYAAPPDGHARWIDELSRYGIRSLQNERVSVGDAGPGGAAFDLAGVNDWSAPLRHRSDLPRALAGRDPERSLVLLAHQPRGVAEAVRSGVELQLSGHTHGGQIFPWTFLVAAAFPYFRGLYAHREGDRQGQVFVSCGTGYWGPPIRLGAPAEITRLVLTS
jgi:uncharacterized protein